MKGFLKLRRCRASPTKVFECLNSYVPSQAAAVSFNDAGHDNRPGTVGKSQYHFNGHGSDRQIGGLTIGTNRSWFTA
jgi:hypothetical protein